MKRRMDPDKNLMSQPGLFHSSPAPTRSSFNHETLSAFFRSSSIIAITMVLLFTRLAAQTDALTKMDDKLMGIFLTNPANQAVSGILPGSWQSLPGNYDSLSHSQRSSRQWFIGGANVAG